MPGSRGHGDTEPAKETEQEELESLGNWVTGCLRLSDKHISAVNRSTKTKH